MEFVKKTSSNTLFIADDQGYTGLSVNGYGFALNNQLNLHVSCGDRGHDNFGDSGKDFDFFIQSCEGFGHNGDRDLFRAVPEEQVVAVVQLVGVGLVVEGGNTSGFNAASSGDLVGRNLFDRSVN